MAHHSGSEILDLVSNRVSIRYEDDSDLMYIGSRVADTKEVSVIESLIEQGLLFVEQLMYPSPDEDEEIVTCGLRHVRLTDFGRRMVNS